jgi:PAS domain S-box-containing protein
MNEYHEGLPVRSVQRDAALRESEERFRSAFEGAAIGFALIEINGRVRSANRSLSEMLGFTEAELRRRTFAQLSHHDDVPLTNSPSERLLAGEIESYQLEKRYLRKDGHVVWAVLAVSLVRHEDGTPAYFVAQVTDITPHKEAEQTLARHTADLERSNADLEAFAYVASHDLQQPLRTVSSYAQLFADRYRGQMDERADRWLGFILSGVERMRRLTNDLLTLARVRTDAAPFAATDTHVIVERVWQLLRDAHVADDATLSLGALPVLDADAAQLTQLFQNLLGNACKYRRPFVHLAVGVSAARQAEAGAIWEFTVRDNGIGFDMVHAERIFELFQRLHREGEYDGTGIGLAICRRIVERHGGRIWAESIPGHRATFFFTLPEHSPSSLVA